MLEETLSILAQEQVKGLDEAKVFLPDDLERMERMIGKRAHERAVCRYDCVNMDAFALARRLRQAYPQEKILVLNLANPFEPGGGVRRGARAQEEDLCVNSSLLLSLESKAAHRYYAYHCGLRSPFSSDAMILTPKVQIIRDADGSLLQERAMVSVLTCAAPMAQYGLGDLTQAEYAEMVSQRIHRMLLCAAYHGYVVLVLGAFGCGAFGNDAQLIAALFERETRLFQAGGSVDDHFAQISFAVLDHSPDLYNFRAFSRYFAQSDREGGGRR